MVMTTARMTLEQFHLLPGEKPTLELIDGEVYEKPVPIVPHGTAQWNFTLLIGTNPVTAKGRGYTEVGYDFPGPLRDNHRVPDISFFKAGRPRQTPPYPKDMPDLAVEIRSPVQTVASQRARLAFLRERGVPCTLMIDPETETIYANDGDREWVAHPGDVVTLQGLDGFSFAVDDVFAEG